MSGGNHRGSIFRLLVGDALQARNEELSVPTWGVGSSASKEIREAERELEAAVSAYIAAMSVVWLTVDNRIERAYVERNAIALLSNYGRPHAVDPATADWLGHASSRERVRNSGLWNNMYVDVRSGGSEFIDLLERIIAKGQRPAGIAENC
jgi:hypothetical protein